jgi:tetratricopeptide (TPR) repeat protein/transglutaminase-like putative cysteine protease
MSIRWRFYLLLVLLMVLMWALTAVNAQTSPSPSVPAKADFSQDAAVIEEMSTTIAFDNDGSLTRVQSSRVRVQTDGGVQQWGLLNFPFQSATQVVEIDYVRVHKPDGSILITPPDNVQDLDAEITRSAPFYSDLREKHVAVKGLGKGDVLEYKAHWRSTKPLIPGQFWFTYNFQHEGIVLAERLEISVPAGRAVKVKGPQDIQTVSTAAGSRTYTWTYSKLHNVQVPGSDLKKQTQAALGRLPAPDVQISSFQTWDEVGRWYWNLQKDRIEPSPAIRAKAAELTKGMADDSAKVRALYSFVSLQYRYIGIAFGIGRYQPHAADDVLTNSYGDCKDKHSLLASLLQASGITLYPALISSSWKLDPDVPSPAQFDHIIGYLPQGKDGVWLDTTPEVAPFGNLMMVLRDKQALVMSAEKQAQLITTPADLAAPGSVVFKIDGKLADNGTFDAKVEDTMRGDREIPLRSAFRRVPQSQWKDLVQGISQALGYAGTVSDVTASTPESMTEPFRFSYTYNRKNYPDWSDHHFTVPGLPFFMPPLKDDATDPVWLGSPEEIVSESKVEVPKGYNLQVPSNVNLKYDFAEYHATYSQDHGVLSAKRLLVIKLHEVPVASFDDYRSFVKKLQDDVYRYVQTSSSNSPAIANAPAPATLPSILGGMWSLPESSLSDANRLEIEARSAIGRRDFSNGLKTLKRAVELDPKFTRAWLEIGTSYIVSGQKDFALEAFLKAVESDPKALIARKTCAFVLTLMQRQDAAIDAWREALKIAPNDPDANAGLGSLLLRQKNYSEALTYLEAAAKRDDSPAAQARLGSAYLQAGQTEKGTATLEKALASGSKPEMLNTVAYELAEANAALSKALEYAKKAVDEQEEESYDVDISNLLPEDLACTRKISAYWDTLGWVYFRLGHLDEAESYLRAAWLLSQTAIIGDHLGQTYEQQKQTEKAIHTYRLVLATPEAHSSDATWEETRHRLEHLTSAKAPGRMELLHIDPSASELSQLRSVKLKRLVPGSASAEFFLVFGLGPEIEGVQFISGSEKLKSADQVLKETKFLVAFPAGSYARVVRRAMVVRSAVTGCEAVLLTPDSVTSVR